MPYPPEFPKALTEIKLGKPAPGERQDSGKRSARSSQLSASPTPRDVS